MPPPCRGGKCHPCLRNKLLPLSQQGQVSVPSSQQVERLNVGRIKSSAIERAVRYQHFHQFAPVGGDSPQHAENRRFARVELPCQSAPVRRPRHRRHKPLVNALESTYRRPQAAQWVDFLRSHDELDLGRLTQARRERVFAAFGPNKTAQLYNLGIRRRLAPMLDNDRCKIGIRDEPVVHAARHADDSVQRRDRHRR
jgi:hypothetical protein